MLRKSVTSFVFVCLASVLYLTNEHDMLCLCAILAPYDSVAKQILKTEMGRRLCISLPKKAISTVLNGSRSTPVQNFSPR